MEHEALVLVHGCGTDAHFWDELTPCLSGLSVIALSLPGRGETGGEALTSASEAARWLLERLRERSVRRAIVVGHSFGGAIALETVMHTPQAGDPVVTGLGLVCTGARLRVLPAILEAVTAAAQTGVVADIGRLAYHRDTDPELIERVEAKARHTPTATTMHDWLATHAFDRLGQLGSIDVPTWVVCGSEDGLTPPKYGRYLAEQISGARLELIEGAGHMLPVERPAELAQALQMLIEASVATPAMPGEAS